MVWLADIYLSNSFCTQWGAPLPGQEVTLPFPFPVLAVPGAAGCDGPGPEPRLPHGLPGVCVLLPAEP